MNKFRQCLASVVILGSTLVLTACGGSNSGSNTTEHPQFERVNAVTNSIKYGPTGEIETTNPEFTFGDGSRITNPVKIGYVNTNGGDWNEFSLEDASCEGHERTACSINPGIDFEVGSEIAWWIFYEASEKEGGDHWGDTSYVFTVAGGKGNGNNRYAPEFKYSDASRFSNPLKIGFAETNGGEWHEISLEGASCKGIDRSGYDACTIKPEIYFEQGTELEWWIFYEASEKEGGNHWGANRFTLTVGG